MNTKKAVNVTMDADLLARAKAEGINLSAALDQGVRAKVARLEAERWRRDNAAALSTMAQRIEAEGVAGEEHRAYG
jgi:antitoxin CcdA